MCRRPSTRRARCCRTGMPSNPTYRKVNPADSPIMILALTSDLAHAGQMYDAASTVLAQKLSQVEGVGQATRQRRRAARGARGAGPGARWRPTACRWSRCAAPSAATNANRPLGAVEREDHYWQVAANDQARVAADYAPLVLRWKEGNAVRLADVAEVTDFGAGRAQLRRGQRQARHLAAGVQAAGGQHSGGGGPGARAAAAAQGLHPPGH